MAKSSKESAPQTPITAAGARRVLPRRRRGRASIGPVSSTSPSNMPDRTFLVLLLAGCLPRHLFIEGEGYLLGVEMDVASAASAAAELLAGLWQTVRKERGRAVSCAAIASLGCFDGVACAAAASMGVLVDGWVRLSDTVLRRHV